MRTALRNFEELKQVKGPFTFDVTNRAFIKYFEDRTGYVITKCQCGWLVTLNLILNPPTDVWRITRAKLQDCWEIFNQTPRLTQPVFPV